MNREKAVSGLQIAMYMLNLAAVCLVAGIMSFSLKAIVRSKIGRASCRERVSSPV